MAQTTTKPTQQRQAPPPQQNAVAILAPPRLPPPDQQTLAEYDVNREGWRTLTESIFPAATSVTSVMMALDYCKRRKLDIFKHPVHIVPIWNSQADNGKGGKGAMVETIWPGINELRTTAIRTGQYAGMDVPVFGPMQGRLFTGKIKKWNNGQAFFEEVKADVAFPEWCQITVYRTLGGNRVPFPGPRVYWLEAYARLRNDVEVPNSMWEKRANGQLEKCAEAAALRRAFPEELGSDYSIDEIGAFTTHSPTDITSESSVTTAPAQEPKRSDYTDPPNDQTPPPPAPPAGDSGSGQPADASPSKAGAGSDQHPPGPSSRPVTDVVDEADKDAWPERPKPGEKLEFARFAKVSEFCEFADPFLEKTNAEGAKQFLEFYEGTIVAMERGKPAAKEAAKEYRATLAKLIGEREPGEEG